MLSPCEQPAVLMLVNPTAGRGRARRLVRPLLGQLEAAAREVEVFESRAEGQIAQRASRVEDPATVLLVVGGDGTVREAVDGLTVSAPVAFLPCGSANVLARELNLPRTPRGVARLIAAGSTRQLDTGELIRGPGDRSATAQPAGKPRTFLLMVGAGIDGRIVRRVHARRRGGTLGKLRYVGPVLNGLLAYQPIDHWIDLPDGTRHGPFAQVIVANARSYGGFWKLPAGVTIDDGALDVVGLRAPSRSALLAHAARGLVGSLAPGAALFHARAERVRITADRPSDVQADGDPGGACPCTVRIRPASLRIFAP